eukprot:m.195753 g.195753  ORF g.195753 m.195753 type:complete len:52 (-) comp10080_c0_seq17:205-360(-)
MHIGAILQEKLNHGFETSLGCNSQSFVITGMNISAMLQQQTDDGQIAAISS